MVHWDVIGDGVSVYLRESKASEEAKRRGLIPMKRRGLYADPRDPSIAVAKSEKGGAVLARIQQKKKVDKKPARRVPTEPTRPKPKPTKKRVPAKVGAAPPAHGKRIQGKDKTLKKINTSRQKVFNEKLQPGPTEFAKRNKKFQLTARPFKFKGKFATGKFPLKYISVLQRMIGTELTTKTKKWSHFSDLPGGEGRASAQAGELMSMMGVTMNDKTADAFFSQIMAYSKEVARAAKKTGRKPIVDPTWVKAAVQNREGILKRMRQQYGEGAQLLNAAWDVREEVESLGLPDYDTNKGFSTDVYFKIKTADGNVVLDEVSLKKSIVAKFLNGGVGEFAVWDPDLPNNISQRAYGAKQTAALVSFMTKKQKSIKRALAKNPKGPLAKTLREKGVSDPLTPLAAKRPNRDARKIMLSAAVELARAGDMQAKKLLKNSNDRHKLFIRDAVMAVSKNPRIRDGMLGAIRNEFPLKSVAQGEETMAIGPYVLDPPILETIFGTRDFEVIKERLVAEPGPPPFVGYRAGPEKVIPIAKIDIRENGIGYAGQIRFDLVLDNRFAKILKQANAQVYP